MPCKLCRSKCVPCSVCASLTFGYCGSYLPQDNILISLECPLGYHGIFGSIGIAAGPFLAAVVLWSGATWREYYLLLAIPGVLLAIVLNRRLKEDRTPPSHDAAHSEPSGEGFSRDRLIGYAILITIGAISGFLYAALLNFLPRYLGEANLQVEGVPAASMRNGLAAAVLLVGCIGQFLAGRFARPDRLAPFLAAILLATSPFLFWMAYAQGATRVWAAALFALTHFMHQPIYNSLVAQYVPSSRRSLGFGLSNLMTFGMGSFGAGYAGYVQEEYGQSANYNSLAIMALVGAALAVFLSIFNARKGL